MATYRSRLLLPFFLSIPLAIGGCGDPDDPFGDFIDGINQPPGNNGGTTNPDGSTGSNNGGGSTGDPNNNGGNPGGGNPGGGDGDAGAPGSGGQGDAGGPGPSGDAGEDTTPDPDPGTDEPEGSEADYRDPGKGPWQKVDPSECKLDASKLNDRNIGTYAIFRYGKLCHMKGGDGVGQMFSATKTLGGVMVGRAAYLTRDVPRTGPGTGTIIPEDKAIDWLGRVSYNRDASLTHVMGMVAHSRSLDNLTWSYDTIGSVQINTMIDVVEKAIRQVPGLGTSAQAFMRKEIFEKMGMSNSSWSTALGISTGWTANLSDMGKLGTLLLHDGWYGGERLVAREWVYRMSHPAFEEANTSYGQLTWLNHRGNAAGIGGNITTGANAPEGDPCAPAAFWPQYPHGLSKATDCRAKVGSCKQKHDVGVFSAQGLNGQFIVMHPGLDLVIAARNFSGGDGPLGLWRAVRPALVAMDPVFQGDEEAFCKAYGAGDYAPDLPMPRRP